MAEVYNHDVVGIVQRLDRFRFEMFKCVSAGTSELNEFDRARIQYYLDALTAYIDWLTGRPQLDLPESHPKPFAISDAPATEPVESEIVNDIIRIMDVTRTELCDSQSARRSSGLISWDEGRIRALIAKLNVFLTDYVDHYTPLDLPESSPQAAMSGHGRKGV